MGAREAHALLLLMRIKIPPLPKNALNSKVPSFKAEAGVTDLKVTVYQTNNNNNININMINHG